MIELEGRKWLFAHKFKSRYLDLHKEHLRSILKEHLRSILKEHLRSILKEHAIKETARTMLLFIPNLVYPEPLNCGWSMDTE